MQVLINNIEYRPKTSADALPDNWQALLVKRIVESRNGLSVLSDCETPNFWIRATGKEYDTSEDPCINDLRRFFLAALCGDNINLDKKHKGEKI